MTDKRLTFFYDGACPLCRREIAFYKRLDKDGRVDWRDVSTGGADDELRPGLTRGQALQAMTAETPAGEIKRGAAAFVAVWRELPGFRWLAPLAALPPVLWLLERAYRGFLKVRPRLTGRRPAACAR